MSEPDRPLAPSFLLRLPDELTVIVDGVLERTAPPPAG